MWEIRFSWAALIRISSCRSWRKSSSILGYLGGKQDLQRPRRLVAASLSPTPWVLSKYIQMEHRLAGGRRTRAGPPPYPSLPSPRGEHPKGLGIGPGCPRQARGEIRPPSD